MCARLILAAATLVLGACSAAGPGRAAPRVVVSAAISVSDALRTVAVEFERADGVAVVLNAAGSDTLATQLIAGARADLFLSADERQMDRVQAAGLIVEGTRVDLLTNQLVVVERIGQPALISGIADLLSPSIRRISMGDPEAVPAGVYARQYLQSVGLWDRVRSKVVPTRNVRAALAAVEAGNADLGIVYQTDLAISPQVRVGYAIPFDEGPTIRYQAAVTTDAEDGSVARRFLAYLRGAEARRIFEAEGFIMADGTS